MSGQRKGTAPFSHYFKGGNDHPLFYKGDFIKKEE
jgi:hypothetical protein